MQGELKAQLSEDTSQSSQTYLYPPDQKGKLVDKDFLSTLDTDEEIPSLEHTYEDITSLEQFKERFYFQRFPKILFNFEIKLICYIIKHYFRVKNVKSLKFTEIFSFLEEFKNI